MSRPKIARAPSCSPIPRPPAGSRGLCENKNSQGAGARTIAIGGHWRRGFNRRSPVGLACAVLFSAHRAGYLPKAPKVRRVQEEMDLRLRSESMYNALFMRSAVLSCRCTSAAAIECSREATRKKDSARSGRRAAE